jgi:hypothetical protein
MDALFKGRNARYALRGRQDGIHRVPGRLGQKILFAPVDMLNPPLPVCKVMKAPTTYLRFFKFIY